MPHFYILFKFLRVQLWSLIAITGTVGLPSCLVLEISDLQLQFFLSVECAGIWCLRIVLAPLHHSHHPDMILPLLWRIIVINGHNRLYVVLPFHSILNWLPFITIGAWLFHFILMLHHVTLATPSKWKLTVNLVSFFLVHLHRLR